MGRPRAYCDAHARSPRTAGPRVAHECSQCGSTFMATPWKTDRQRYCSEPCRRRAFWEARLADGRWEIQREKRRTTVAHPCVDCGKDIWVGERCRACYKTASGIVRNVPPTDRRATYERDGWICKLCGEPVDREAVAPHPLAPTIDHIVPLAKCLSMFGLDYVDGTHNWQTAHYRCNCQKGKREAA